MQRKEILKNELTAEHNHTKHNNKIVLTCVVSLIFLILLIFAIFLPEWAKHINLTYPQVSFINYNWLWFLVAGAICILAFVFFVHLPYKLNSLILNIRLKHIAILVLIMFIFQLAIVASNFFIAGWDVHILFFDGADKNQYFSCYPNNLFLRGLADFITSKIMTQFVALASGVISALSSLSPASLTYFGATLLNCVLVSVTTFMMYVILCRTIGKVSGFFAWVFYVAIVNFLSWILVPYSDIYAMCFVVFLLFERVQSNKKFTFYCWAIPTTIIAIAIKPTVVFLFGSFALFDFFSFLANFFKTRKPKSLTIHKPAFYIKRVFLTFVTCALALSFVSIIKAQANVEIDSDKEFSAIHFAMLGLNTQTDGTLNEDEFNVSLNTKNCDERKTLNLQVIKDRLNNLGVFGVAQLYTKKLVGTFSDGSFAWHLDGGGNFCDTEKHLNTFLTGIYDRAKPTSQVLWFAVMLGIASVILSCLYCLVFKNKQYGKYIAIFNNELINPICLTALAYILFLMVFECGARYVVVYLPVFICIAIYGWYSLYKLIKDWKTR